LLYSLADGKHYRQGVKVCARNRLRSIVCEMRKSVKRTIQGIGQSQIDFFSTIDLFSLSFAFRSISEFRALRCRTLYEFNIGTLRLISQQSMSAQYASVPDWRFSLSFFSVIDVSMYAFGDFERTKRKERS
jgi:hypothetical protein